MNTKLTLTIEDKIIENAKLYAKSKGRSLSNLIENYLKLLTIQEEESKSYSKSYSPIVNSLKGSFKEPENFDYKKEISESISKKYIK